MTTKYIVGGDMTAEKDAKEPIPVKAQFSPYFKLAGHYFNMALGDSKNESCLSDPHRLQMRNILIRDVLSLQRDLSPEEEEPIIWAELCKLENQVHQSQAYQAVLKVL